MPFRSASTGVAGTGTSVAISVPSGLQVDDIVLIGLYVETADATITWPTGFTQRADVPGTANATTRGRLLVAWKRITSAGDVTDEGDGDYDISWTTSALYKVDCLALSGIARIANPFEADSGIASTSSSATTTPTASYTSTSTSDLVCFTTNHATNAGAWADPSGFTQRSDDSSNANAHLSSFTLDSQAAGAKSVSTTFTGTTGNSYPRIWSGALTLDRVARYAAPTSGDFTSVNPTITLPAHAAGCRLVVLVSGKPETMTTPSMNQGFTLVGSTTGGTGTLGADTGQVYYYVFAKDAASGAETNPTLTLGSGNNVGMWVANSYLPAKDKTWADVIEASADWVQFINDSDSSTGTFTGTASAFGDAPVTGDAILTGVGCPSDAGSSFSAVPTMTMTGLSGGTKAVALYTDTLSLNDFASGIADWVDFTGTGSSGLTYSGSFASNTNGSGVIACVSLRQATATIDLTVAGTMPLPTLAVSLTGFNASNLTVAATMPLPTLAVSLTGFNASNLSIAATMPLPTLAVSLNVAPLDTQLTVAATMPLPTLAVALDAPLVDVDLSIAATMPLPTLAVSLSTVTEITVAGTMPLPVLAVDLEAEVTIDDPEPVEIDQEIVDDEEVDQEGHEEDWHPDVAVVEPSVPLPVAYDVLRTYTSISLDGTQPVIVGSATARKLRLRDRILIDNVDVTFYNGVRTPTPDYSLIEPLTWGVCTIVFPQIFPLIQTLSEITWLRRGARVLIQRVDEEGNVVATDYRGRIMVWDTAGDFTVSVGGLFSGPASVRFRPMPMIRRIQDVSYWLMTAFRHQHQPLEYEDFGVDLITRGENYYLDHVLELCSLGVKRDGSQVTVHYDEDLKKWIAAPKDTTTIHATVYFDPGYMNPGLTRDFTAETDEVFATAHLSDGTQILNSVWPGMQQEDPIPPYPGVLEEGDDNEDVAVLIARLALLGYIKYAEKAGGYDEDVVDAILAAREDADQLGTANDEALDEPLWEWLWDLDAVGYTDQEARILPMAQKRKVRYWNRSATGNRLSLNPFYDPVHASLTVSQKLELGHVKSKNHAKKLARTLLDDGSDNWVGTLSTVMSFVAGEHTPGDPITEDDVMSGRELRPGMNLWAPLFQGGTLFHISSIDISNDGNEWSLALDTRSRDTMQIDGILERNRENRTSPARAFWNARSSSTASDTIFSHDEHFGKLGSNIPLPANEWTVYPMPAGDFGEVAHVIMRTISSPAEFAMMVFQKKVTAEWLTIRVANPLNAADEWWANEGVRADFKDRGIKYAAGSEDNPCGYFPGRKSEGHDLTGRWEDDASFAYGGDSLVFWVCVYPDRSSVLKRGDQFYVQRELGT